MGMVRGGGVGGRAPASVTRTAGADTAAAAPPVKPVAQQPTTQEWNFGAAPDQGVGGWIQPGDAGFQAAQAAYAQQAAPANAGFPAGQAQPPAGGLQSLVNLGKKQPTLQELVALQQAQNKPTTRGW
jgi:hypothetical protein